MDIVKAIWKVGKWVKGRVDKVKGADAGEAALAKAVQDVLNNVEYFLAQKEDGDKGALDEDGFEKTPAEGREKENPRLTDAPAKLALNLLLKELLNIQTFLNDKQRRLPHGGADTCAAHTTPRASCLQRCAKPPRTRWAAWLRIAAISNCPHALHCTYVCVAFEWAQGGWVVWGQSGQADAHNVLGNCRQALFRQRN